MENDHNELIRSTSRLGPLNTTTDPETNISTQTTRNPRRVIPHDDKTDAGRIRQPQPPMASQQMNFYFLSQRVAEHNYRIIIIIIMIKESTQCKKAKGVRKKNCSKKKKKELVPIYTYTRHAQLISKKTRTLLTHDAIHYYIHSHTMGIPS